MCHISYPCRHGEATGTLGLKALPAVKLGRKEKALALGFGFKRGQDDSVNVPWVGRGIQCSSTEVFGFATSSV